MWQLFESLPALRYLNLYRSGRAESTEVEVKGAASLIDLALESCPFVQSVRVDKATCRLLQRVVLCRGETKSCLWCS